jgi:hypothetical protein
MLLLRNILFLLGIQWVYCQQNPISCVAGMGNVYSGSGWGCVSCTGYTYSTGSPPQCVAFQGFPSAWPDTYPAYFCSSQQNGGCASITACTTHCTPSTYSSRTCSYALDALCTPCPVGTFNNNNFQITTAYTWDQSCSVCMISPPGSYLFRACTTTVNAAYTGCPSNSYCVGGTTPPSACSVCPAGTYQSSACTSTTDTQCSSCSLCPAGTYQSGVCTSTIDAQCSSCSVCPAGTYQSGACTSTTDTQCAVPCAPGTYKYTGGLIVDDDTGSEM